MVSTALRDAIHVEVAVPPPFFDDWCMFALVMGRTHLHHLKARHHAIGNSVSKATHGRIHVGVAAPPLIVCRPKNVPPSFMVFQPEGQDILLLRNKKAACQWGGGGGLHYVYNANVGTYTKACENTILSNWTIVHAGGVYVE